MGTIISVVPARLVSGIITSTDELFVKTERLLAKKFGPADYRSPIIPFDFTTYYEKDMGSGLKRQFLSFQRLIDPNQLVKIKRTTNTIENDLSRYSSQIKRPVNIDPGYITDAKLVLASTKDYYHRIYLDRGVYAEVTLFFKRDSFQPLDWTYPDYRSDDYIKIFNEIRNIYMRQREV